MNGMIGFLENPNGRHLRATADALRRIGAPKCAAILESVMQCMAKHGVTWEKLRGDFEGTSEYQITSFTDLHGEETATFGREVNEISKGFSLLNPLYSPDDAYSALVHHLNDCLDRLNDEIERRLT